VNAVLDYEDIIYLSYPREAPAMVSCDGVAWKPTGLRNPLCFAAAALAQWSERPSNLNSDDGYMATKESLIVLLVIGGIAGWLAGVLMKGRGLAGC